MSKICNECGRTVDDSVNFCPYCKSQSFRLKQELTVPESDMVHRIFYWPYPGGHVLSKSKICAMGVFLFFISMFAFSKYFAGGLILSVIFAAIALLIGFIVHKIKPNPPAAKIEYNDYGLVPDFIHFLFFWQDKKGNYVISKTKLITVLVFIAMLFLFLVPKWDFPVALVVGMIFAIPTFFIGYGIHRLTFKESDQKPIPPKREKKKVPKPVKNIPAEEPSKPEETSVYEGYKRQIEELNSKFESKEKSTRELIEKRFEPPQLTYTRFITGVDKSSELFRKNSDSALTMIDLADEYSPRIAGEIESKIDILKEILHKMEDLANELVLNDDISKKEDVDSLMYDMDDLIKSVRDYD